MDFEQASRIYRQEVDQEAARLVRDGMAPLDAIKEAGEIVRDRRQRAARRRAEAQDVTR